MALEINQQSDWIEVLPDESQTVTADNYCKNIKNEPLISIERAQKIKRERKDSVIEDSVEQDLPLEAYDGVPEYIETEPLVTIDLVPTIKTESCESPAEECTDEQDEDHLIENLLDGGSGFVMAARPSNNSDEITLTSLLSTSARIPKPGRSLAKQSTAHKNATDSTSANLKVPANRTRCKPAHYRCKCCGGVFDLESFKLHKCDKPFVCGYCGRGFTQSYNLARHLAIHQHPCFICQKNFSTALLLQNHLQEHSEETHVCAVCDVEFRRIFDLERHMLNHSESHNFDAGH